MDSSDDESKPFSLKEICPFDSYRLSISVTVSGIHRAILDNDLEVVKHLVEAGESVNIREEKCGYTPLHLAVIRDSAGILDYLLSRDGIEVDGKDFNGESPLQTASDLGAYESVKKLIDAGADVNVSDCNRFTPLHKSVRFPDICRLLLENGADTDAISNDGFTPLSCSIDLDDLESMYMLLYYNADLNIPDEVNMSPLLDAIYYQKIEVQRALLDYVVDLNAPRYCSSNACTLLRLALQYNSPFIIEMIEKGADVNYGDIQISNWRDCAFIDCLYGMEGDCTAFKVVWERLRCYQERIPINLCKLFKILRPCYYASVVQVIVESDNFELVVDSFTRNKKFYLFAREFIKSGLEVEQLVVLTYRLLECGYRPSLEDVRVVFYEYGPCGLSRILRYMDVDCKAIYGPESKTYLRATFDLGFDAAILADKIDSGRCRLSSEELVSVLEYFRDPYLMNVLQLKFSENKIMSEILNSVLKLPSLVELARNQARKCIREKYKVTNTCQFYTIMDCLEIPSLCKSIITFSRKIYRVETSDK